MSMNARTAICSLLPCIAARRLSAIGAFVLAGLVLFAGLVASSPHLHKLLHHTATEPGHFCFVTLLAHHLVAAADDDVTTATVVVAVAFLLSELRVLFPHFDHESPPGRAPPAFFGSPVR